MSPLLWFHAMSFFVGMTLNKFVTKSCCGYGADGMKTLRDCIEIPSLSTANGKLILWSHFCGQGGLMTKSTVVMMTMAKWKTLCSKLIFELGRGQGQGLKLHFLFFFSAKKQPFSITFNSDSYEFKNEVKNGVSANNGFKLNYIASSSNC